MLTSFPEVKIAPFDQTTDSMILEIWDMINNDDCVDFMYRGISNDKSLKETVEALLDKCLRPDPMEDLNTIIWPAP